MTNDKSTNALNNDPTDSILTIIGKDYKEFVGNLERMFPGKGKYVASTIASNRRDRLYRIFTVLKKYVRNPKPRDVASPSEILKFLQSETAAFVGTQFTDHAHSHGFVPGRSTRTAAEKVRNTKNINEKVLTNIDVKGAFPAVTGKAIRSLLRHKTVTHQLNNWQIVILSKIVTNSRDTLATGSPASPIIFNWRLTAADTELERIAAARGWEIVRYADDISVIHYQTQKKEAIEVVSRILARFGLTIERKKLKSYAGPLKKIVGLNVLFGEITVPRRLRRKMRALAFKLRIYGITPRNRYQKAEEAYKGKNLIPRPLTRHRGSIEAQLAGFYAYLIHVLKPITGATTAVPGNL